MIRAVLFDFGGTIDTDGVHWSEKFWEIYERLRLPVSKADYERGYVYSGEQISSGIIKPGDSFLTMLERQAHFQMIYLKEHGKLDSAENLSALAKKVADQGYRDVREVVRTARKTLDRLKDRYVLGLVSNFLGNLEEVVTELGLSGYFQCIVDSARVGVSKPDPGIFEIALKKMRITASDSVVVGDSYDRDIVPAKKLGCLTLWVYKRSWKEPEETCAADFTVDSIAKIPGLLSRSQMLS